MLKKILFQLHWLLGISAGTVLALMGLTGATLSFQDEIVRWSDPQQAAVVQAGAEGAQVLPLPELLRRLQVDEPAAMGRISIDPSGRHPSRLRLEGAGERSEVYFNPYTGQRLSELRGEHFFELIEDLHRRLAAGERGKAVTGVCVIVLVFFCLSGLYLRWPRRWWSPREWWLVEWRRQGRSFLWSLHSVVGTWCLLLYLVIALTGLYWSYGWYRQGLQQWLGAPAIAQQGPAGGGQGGRAGHGGGRPSALDLQRLQAVIDAEPGLRGRLLDLRIPNGGKQPLTLRSLPLDAAHDRAYDVIEIDRRSGVVLKREPYAALPPGRKLLASLFALHSGSFFGLPGRIAWMLAALCMSLFFVTGWLLYLDRRRKKRALRHARGALAATAGAGEPWLIGHASQSGFAEQLAWQAAGQLQAAGLPVQVRALGQLDAAMLGRARRALLVVSTFGDGQAPDAARGMERSLLRQSLPLPELQYALLALGDRQYPQFCGFGRQVDAWLQSQGAQPMFASVEVDNADPQALADWQRQLAIATGVEASAPVLEAPPALGWRLLGRQRLNPGSVAGEVWRIDLAPPANAHWQAGDILVVQPAASAEGPDGKPVPLREYSIASVMADGVLQLVVRLALRADGQPGLGSGWLCRQAPLGSEVQARVRANPGFRRHAGAPMLLIGNGTGIAGLRSLLREAEQAGEHGHWLLYGERQAAHDLGFADELRGWADSGHLRHLELAFSRDQPHKVYVQHLLAEAAPRLRQWLADGAVIHVCGSLAGMAEAVDAELRRIIGDAGLDALAAAGRYRRDVY